METPPAHVAELADARGFGPHVLTEVLADAGVACAGLAAVPIMLAPGIGLTVGPYNPWVKALGVMFLVLAVVLPMAGYHAYHREYANAPRLHCFQQGLILASGDDLQPHLWSEIEVTRRIETVLVGQGPDQHQVHHLDVRTRDGRLLVTMSGHIRPITRVEALAHQRRP
ncbi:hypothetical protein [Acrocarpospora sp. B8E8]|uniref:hypothetical protein n=1 Tax=Acrocarpospora sp. B8E8 TaxID=3153572 RepID=UPI00325ECA03